jgi:hypothetical protein
MPRCSQCLTPARRNGIWLIRRGSLKTSCSYHGVLDAVTSMTLRMASFPRTLNMAAPKIGFLLGVDHQVDAATNDAYSSDRLGTDSDCAG